MKKIILICLLLISGLIGFSQSDIQRSNGLNRLIDPRLAATKTFNPPSFIDTTAANLVKGTDSCGALIFTYDVNNYWIRKCSPKRWEQVGSGSGSTSITNIYNNSITGATIAGNCIYVNLGSGTNLDTVCSVTLSAITSFQFLSDTSALVCGYTLPDTLTIICDTLYFSNPNSAQLYIFDNGLTQVSDGHIQWGGNLVKNTGLDAGYYYVNFYGRTVQDYPYKFRQYQSWGNSTAIASYRNDLAAVQLGFNYTSEPFRTVAQGGYIPGFFAPYKGYWLGLNGIGKIADGLGNLLVDSNTWKTDFIFFHGSDTSNNYGITLGAIDPAYSGTTTSSPMYQNMALTIKTNKDLKLWNYDSTTRNDGALTKALGTDANGNLILGTVSSASTTTATFPLKAIGGDISLFPKIPQQNPSFQTASPYAVTLQWDTTTTNTTPNWYDGTALAYTPTGDTLVRPYGWYSNGVTTYSSDSQYLSVPPYNVWTLSTTRFPIKTHWVAYTYNRARGYWVFCGGDPANTATEQKSVITTVDFRTFTTRTTNYGGSVRALGSVWCDDNGVIYWGFGVSDILDSANHLDDIWMSTDDGVTWTQIATNISVNGFRLGGNDGNQFHVRDGFVFGLGVGSKYGNNGKSYSNKCFKASLSDLTKWWAIDTIPGIPVQYPATRLFDGLLWYINGSSSAPANVAQVYYLDQNDKWHPFNIGGNGVTTQINISHAQGSIVYKNSLYLSTGNDNNVTYILKRLKTEYIDGYKLIIPNNSYAVTSNGIYIGTDGLPSNLRLNTTVGSEAANTFAEFNAPSTSRTYALSITSDNAFPAKIASQTVSNNLTGINFNSRVAPFTGHATGTFANVLFGLYDISGSNYLPLLVKSNGHLIVNNNSTSIPTNVSALQVIGLTRTTATGSKLMSLYDTTTGDFYYTDVSSSSSGLYYGVRTDVSLTRTMVVDTTTHRIWYYGLDGYNRQIAIADSVSQYDSDVNAYVAALATAGYTATKTEKDALQRTVNYMKGNSLWTPLEAFYPVLGSTAAQHAINLKSPGTYDLTFTGGYTHASNVFTPNGSTGYANTGINPSTFSDQNQITVATYTTNAGSGGIDIGVIDGTKQVTLVANLAGSTIIRLGSDANQIFTTPTASTGWIGATRTSSTSMRYCLDGNGNITTNTGANSGNFPNRPIYLNAWNSDGTAATFCGRNMKIAAIWSAGMTSTQWSNLYTEIAAFVTSTGK